MMKQSHPGNIPNHRKNERGAALITSLLVATLLLVAGGALIQITSMSAANAIDSTAETQAYYGAEAGLQAALNAIRGNATHTASALPSGMTTINFRNAVIPSSSNDCPNGTGGDPSTVARLSRWLPYSARQTAGTRVIVGSNPTVQYDVVVSLPPGDVMPASPTEPSRLLIRATGYGPNMAKKQIELLISHSTFDYGPPAMLMMRGADDGTALTFTIGNSNAKDYSGHDRSSSAILPAFGSTSAGDMAIEIASDGKGTVAAPKAATIANSGLPSWLQTADNARAFVAAQKASAISQNRYFTSFSGDSGTSTVPAFTFVDGDCNLSGGSGLLIVTGDLNMSGNPNFSGLILVLGNGTWHRNGGGNGNIYGAMAVAHFDSTGNFLAPSFTTNGGGNATLQYDSLAVQQAMNTVGYLVLGVHEY